MRSLVSAALLTCLANTLATAGNNWPEWRGPTRNGVSDSRDLPAEWGPDQNIVWKAKLPSWSAATPIIWGDRVFIVSPTEQDTAKVEAAEPDDGGRRRGPRGPASPGGDEILLICFDKQSGKELWRQAIDNRNTLHGKQNSGSPSPVTDGKHVWVVTGAGRVAAFDMDGEQVWTHDLTEQHGPIELMWGYASSPILFDGHLIIEVLHQRGPSYLVAFDGPTGKQLWWVERKTDATRECPDAYNTPTILTHDGRTDLIVSGADYVTGHNPQTGEERWRAAGLNPENQGNYRVCGSPVAVDGMIYATSRKQPVIALRAGGEGDVSRTHLAWKREEGGGPDVPTPACDGELYYMVDDGGRVTCVDPKTGQTLWGPQRTAQGNCSASPLLADGKLYVLNEKAVTTVLKAGREFEVLATNELDGGYTLSSIAVSGSQLFIRTADYLYCIGATAD